MTFESFLHPIGMFRLNSNFKVSQNSWKLTTCLSAMFMLNTTIDLSSTLKSYTKALKLLLMDKNWDQSKIENLLEIEIFEQTQLNNHVMLKPSVYIKQVRSDSKNQKWFHFVNFSWRTIKLNSYLLYQIEFYWLLKMVSKKIKFGEISLIFC